MSAIGNPQSSTEQLEHLCRVCTTLLNAGDFTCSTPLGKLYKSHISPTFTAQFDAHDKLLTFSELFKAFENWYELYPGFRCEYKRFETIVDEAAGSAVVHFELDLMYESMGQAAIGEVRFKRDLRGEWMMESYIGMRGMHGMGGYV
ncbi:hypothetical protein PRZ48_005025 [Zasmidium cellare]|uniref:SnoaL-like domain-containing protein n=1 Tax=Zasmidium cellare TaxID=395010 RepID=A0ABR0ERJ4_ZASCE|nr:hypothetical protein PRZ48_005025 [Zasmidium cellare]